MSELQRRLAWRVKAMRHERGWSQENLAERADMHYTYVGSIERNERNLSLRNIGKLAQAFEITASELLRIGDGPKGRERAEAALFVLLRSFETKELRFIGLLLKVLLRWKKAAVLQS